MYLNGFDVTRFWLKVTIATPQDCWDWKAGLFTTGYGKFGLRGKTVQSHRVAYSLVKGLIPIGEVVRHTCDNRKCVNPDHLITGTAKDNVQDAIDRGRFPRGSSSGNSKLTEMDVLEIRSQVRNGTPDSEIADAYGISVNNLWFIKTGATWKHVDGDIKHKHTISRFALTDKDVADIQRLYATGQYKQSGIAELYSVTPSVICRAINGKYKTDTKKKV